MLPRPFRKPLFVLALPLLTVAAMCNTATSPRYQPEVTNAANNFQFQVTGLDGITDALTYAWQNDGTAATVNQSAAITGGSATLTILDGSGTQVYSRGLADNGTYPTSAGTAGMWQIRVTFAQTSGTVNFRVQKSP